MHLKRQAIPKNWPVGRKETKYVVRPGSNQEHGLSVLIILRDILKITQNRKEVRNAIFQKNILVDNKPIKDEKRSVLLFDTITVVPSKKSYRLTLGENGKFKLESINEKEAGIKIVKITDRKTLKGKKTQFNFNDGKNLISNIKCNTGDSAIIDLKGKKIERIIPLKEKSKVFVYSGKHAGQTGEIIKLDRKEKIAEVKFKERSVRVLIKQLIAIE